MQLYVCLKSETTNTLIYEKQVLSFIIVCSVFLLVYMKTCTVYISLFLGLRKSVYEGLKVKMECFTCPNCSKVYTHKKTLSRHIRQECGIEPELHCPYCPYRARRAYVLASHVKSHSLYINI